MNIDRDTDFGSIEPLMLKISEHLKTDPDPKTNGSRYNKVWDIIFDFLEDRASAHNSDYTKLPKFEVVFKKAYELDKDKMTVATFYECLKELGNFA